MKKPEKDAILERDNGFIEKHVKKYPKVVR
jgi:hypothetical protein